jgi:hypothetical protein
LVAVPWKECINIGTFNQSANYPLRFPGVGRKARAAAGALWPDWRELAAHREIRRRERRTSMKWLLTHRKIRNPRNYVGLVAASIAAEPLTIDLSTQTTSATFDNRRLCIIGLNGH